MDITTWTNKELIDLIKSRKHVLQTDIADTVFNKLGKDYNPYSFASKLSRNSMKLEEFQAACKAYGFKLILEEDGK